MGQLFVCLFRSIKTFFSDVCASIPVLAKRGKRGCQLFTFHLFLFILSSHVYEMRDWREVGESRDGPIFGMFAVLIKFEEVETWWFINHWKVGRIPKKSERNKFHEFTTQFHELTHYAVIVLWLFRVVYESSSSRCDCDVIECAHEATCYLSCVSKTFANRAKKRGTKWKKTKEEFWSH